MSTKAPPIVTRTESDRPVGRPVSDRMIPAFTVRQIIGAALRLGYSEAKIMAMLNADADEFVHMQNGQTDIKAARFDSLEKTAGKRWIELIHEAQLMEDPNPGNDVLGRLLAAEAKARR